MSLATQIPIQRDVRVCEIRIVPSDKISQLVIHLGIRRRPIRHAPRRILHVASHDERRAVRPVPIVSGRITIVPPYHVATGSILRHIPIDGPQQRERRVMIRLRYGDGDVTNGAATSLVIVGGRRCGRRSCGGSSGRMTDDGYHRGAVLPLTPPDLLVLRLSSDRYIDDGVLRRVPRRQSSSLPPSPPREGRRRLRRDDVCRVAPPDVPAASPRAVISAGGAPTAARRPRGRRPRGECVDGDEARHRRRHRRRRRRRRRRRHWGEEDAAYAKDHREQCECRASGRRSHRSPLLENVLKTLED
jgi:hypothetical protein